MANYYLGTNYSVGGLSEQQPGKCFGFTDFLATGLWE